MGLYRSVARPLLFAMDAESAHHAALRTAELAGASKLLCAVTTALHRTASERLVVDVAGMRLASPLGLAAGFDKSARAVNLLGALGFSHVEVGSISLHRSAGNALPRLFRLPRDSGIVVNYGLPNDGAEAVAQRLRRSPPAVPLGINVVSTNRGPDAPPQPDDAVIDDYVQTALMLEPLCAYLAVNLSCPNTREGRGFFHDAGRLRALLCRLDERPLRKPLFLKVAPFAEPADLGRFLAIAHDAKGVTGFSVNLPPGKPAGLSTAQAVLDAMPGAVSGAPASAAADRTIRDIYRSMDRSRYCITGSGGIFTAQDAYRKIRLGATLVQLMTALVYEGPGVVAAITRGLDKLLARDGIGNVLEVVGADA